MTEWTRRHKFKIGDRVLFTQGRTLADDLHILGVLKEVPPVLPGLRGTVTAIPHRSVGELIYVVEIDAKDEPSIKVEEAYLSPLPILDRLAEL